MPTKQSKLKNKADKLFSQWIRRKYADGDGNVACYTCDRVKPWKEQQCGHFVSRTHLNTRWDEYNCRVQCGACNVLRRGNYDEFALRLVKEKGENVLKDLNKRKHQTRKMTKADYLELIEDLETKLEMLDQPMV